MTDFNQLSSIVHQQTHDFYMAIEAQIQALLDKGHTLEFLRDNLEVVYYPDEAPIDGPIRRRAALRWQDHAVLELGAGEFGHVETIAEIK